jgi:hypothetical protein
MDLIPLPFLDFMVSRAGIEPTTYGLKDAPDTLTRSNFNKLQRQETRFSVARCNPYATIS